MRMWVWSLVSLSGLRIQHCHEWWCRPAAVAPIWPLALELPYAAGVALKSKKKKERKKNPTKHPKPTWFYIYSISITFSTSIGLEALSVPFISVACACMQCSFSSSIWREYTPAPSRESRAGFEKKHLQLYKVNWPFYPSHRIGWQSKEPFLPVVTPIHSHFCFNFLKYF